MTTNQARERIVPPNRRRDKPQRSCTFCRRRKLKCNRNQPCQNCRIRDIQACIYVSASPCPESSEPREQVDDRPSFDSVPQETPSVSSDQPPEPDDEPPGRMEVSSSGTVYVQKSHWATALGSISNAGEPTATAQVPRPLDSKQDPAVCMPELFRGCGMSISIHDILGSLPPRQTVDSLISWFFGTVDLASVAVHPKVFVKQYDRFWESPSNVSFQWLSLLFSLMCLGAHFNPHGEDQLLRDSEPREDMKQHYRERAAQCLVLGDYTNPTSATIQALIPYLATETIRSSEISFGVHLVFSILVRAAMRLGYHQEPSKFADISVFDGEMRRRTWTWIEIHDTLIASHLGLPRLIASGTANVLPPLNLLDHDFDENTTKLPPSRSSDEPTPIGFLVHKKRLISAFSEIADAVNSNRQCTRARTLELDKMLQEIHRLRPSWLEVKSETSLILDSPNLIIRRISFDTAYQRARCVLYRRSIYQKEPDRDDQRHRSTCLDAALQILRHQLFLDKVLRPGGVLHHDRWKVRWFFTQDFLLAAAILCLELKTRQEHRSVVERTDSTHRSEDLVAAIKKSLGVWAESCPPGGAVQALRPIQRFMDTIAPSTIPSRSTGQEGVRYDGTIPDTDVEQNMQVDPSAQLMPDGLFPSAANTTATTPSCWSEQSYQPEGAVPPPPPLGQFAIAPDMYPSSVDPLYSVLDALDTPLKQSLNFSWDFWSDSDFPLP